MIYKECLTCGYLNCSSVSGNVLGAVGCTAVREGGEAEWVFAWKKQSYLKDALPCTREIWLLVR